MSNVPSNKPYLIRALHQWCTDFGFTPFIAVFVDSRVEVPLEFVKNNEIVLNLSLEACHQLELDNDWISFQARFGGIPRKIAVPVSHVLAIYARENGQGMSFPFDSAKEGDIRTVDTQGEDTEKPKTSRPSLTIVK
jgi:stringent starvation protein B